MPKRTIVQVNDEEEGEAPVWFASYADEWNHKEMTEGKDIIKQPVLTLEELADFCDQEAESRNNHAYVGTHRILAALLHQKIGRAEATALMQEIAEYGGLDGMRGA